VTCGARFVGGRPDADSRIDIGELALGAHGKGAPVFPAVSRIHQDLVVDVGHVANESDVKSLGL
jgi:hypothetical protein